MPFDIGPDALKDGPALIFCQSTTLSARSWRCHSLSIVREYVSDLNV
jgi:hypothetical protein